jgi:hypothetical protein
MRPEARLDHTPEGVWKITKLLHVWSNACKLPVGRKVCRATEEQLRRVTNAVEYPVELRCGWARCKVYMRCMSGIVDDLYDVATEFNSCHWVINLPRRPPNP